MPSPAQKSAAENNLHLAIWFILGIAGGCALYTSYVIRSTLETLSNSNAMALIIVDAGKDFKSDDGKLGDKLNEATLALINTCDVAYALAVGCLLISIALIWKSIRDRL
jgi:beta-lactamase regulating signal transducer with metallopeptidase domain